MCRVDTNGTAIACSQVDECVTIALHRQQYVSRETQAIVRGGLRTPPDKQQATVRLQTPEISAVGVEQLTSANKIKVSIGRAMLATRRWQCAVRAAKSQVVKETAQSLDNIYWTGI